MNKSRKLSLINMCVNLAVIVLEIIGVYFLVTNPLTIKGEPLTSSGADMLKYYTVLTALVTLLAAALMIWANIVSYKKKKDCTPRLFYSMRYLSAVMSLLTLITVIVFIYPEMLKMDASSLNFEPIDVIFGLTGGSIFVHFICPIISIVQFIGFEIELKGKFKKTLEPFIGTLIYAIAIITVIFVKLGNEGADAAVRFAPYFFCLITPELASTEAAINLFGETNYLINIGVTIGVIIISYVAAVVLWGLNRICHNIFIGEVYQVAAPKKAVSTKKATTTTAKTGNAFTNYMKKKVAFTGDESSSGGQVYHISYHDRRLKTWKVKTENAGRALKVFPTQKEAIEFANQCVKKNGGSIRIHSMVGRIRKEW